MQKKAITLAVAASLLTSCASTSADVQGAYVTPLQYARYDCDQIREEVIRVSNRVHEVARIQDKKAKDDKWAMGVGLVIFWPALFFMIGSDRKEELSRLKGEYDALEQVAIQKRCTVADEMKAAEATPARR